MFGPQEYFLKVKPKPRTFLHNVVFDRPMLLFVFSQIFSFLIIIPLLNQTFYKSLCGQVLSQNYLAYAFLHDFFHSLNIHFQHLSLIYEMTVYLNTASALFSSPDLIYCDTKSLPLPLSENIDRFS
jgi:hypothetical protein